MPERPSILVWAYACEPGRGSEPGAGWGIVMALRTFADCTVLVRTDHIRAIRDWQAVDGSSGVEFIEVGERPLARALKRNRIGYFLSYLLWLRTADRASRTLIGSRRFDVVLHATYSAYWLPTPAVDLGLPAVWGPVGGGVVSPFSLWAYLGWRGILGEIIDLFAVRAAALLPATRRTWQRATIRVAQNLETLARLSTTTDTVLLNHALFHVADLDHDSASQTEPYVMWVAPLEARKGPELAIRSMARVTADARFIVVGDGPERSRMQRLAESLGLGDRITFPGWLPRPRVLELMSTARVVMFTGLREEGGLALAEALVMGCPTIVLDHGGAGYLGRRATDPGRVTLVPPSSRRGTVDALAEAIEDHWRTKRDRREPLIDREKATAELENIIRSAMARR